MGQTTAVKKRFEKIKSVLEDQPFFYMDDVKGIFPELSKSTLYWYLSKMVDQGYIRRVRNGVFSFQDSDGRSEIILSPAGVKITELLLETGFDFYLSGLDVLSPFVQHVPESYPSILFIHPSAKEEVMTLLIQNGIEVIFPSRLKERMDYFSLAGIVTDRSVIYFSENFEGSSGELASNEKAFVDLYYSITRNGYPLALQELVRIYENLVRRGQIDTKKLISVASRRNMQHDIRYIVESKYITQEAHKFVKILGREE